MFRKTSQAVLKSNKTLYLAEKNSRMFEAQMPNPIFEIFNIFILNVEM